MSTPLRIIGSPPLAMSRVSSVDSDDSLCVATSLPVSSRPQVAALTNSDGLRPACVCHWPRAILSRMSASRVGLSGMRSSASARHISATPSCEDSAYSCSRPCTRPERPAELLRSRRRCAICRASAWASRPACGAIRACGSRPATAAGSGSLKAAVMRSRSAPEPAGPPAKPRKSVEGSIGAREAMDVCRVDCDNAHNARRSTESLFEFNSRCRINL